MNYNFGKSQNIPNNVQQPVDTGVKYDEGKLRFDLIDPYFEQDVAKVLTLGAEKYGVDNWKLVEDARARYIAAILRHLNAYRCGETVDNESNVSHLAHIATNLMFLAHFDREQQNG